MIKISPSILAANFANLKQEVIDLERAGADMIHIDVMDGHFVPNLTFGPMILGTIKQYTKLPLDVHLMIQEPERHLETYIEAGANIITIHPESTIHLNRVINTIKKHGVLVGVALLPTTNITLLEYIIDDIDQILLMTVNPGFGGQKFIKNQLSKIEKTAKIIDNTNILLAVDGGINDVTAKLCTDSGANMLVSGSFIFGGNYQEQIKKLKGS